MAILNITPDSFSDGGKYLNKENIITRLNEIRSKDVSLVDIGGESTKPFSKRIDASEEWNRIAFAIKYAINIGLKVSVDTYKSEIAEKVLDIGAHMINDISGLTFDEKLPEVVKKYKATLCLMHIKGSPDNMQINPIYTDVIDEVYAFLYNAVV
jgi:dihydropteroate synthase